MGRAVSVGSLAAEPLDCAVRVIRDSMVVVDVGCVWARECSPIITSGGLSALTSFVSGSNILLILVPRIANSSPMCTPLHLVLPSPHSASLYSRSRLHP